MLTATPINNRVHDFRHMAELFTREMTTISAVHLASIQCAVTSFPWSDDSVNACSRCVVRGHAVEAERVLATDTLFKALVVQRSRAYERKARSSRAAAWLSFQHVSRPGRYILREEDIRPTTRDG